MKRALDLCILFVLGLVLLPLMAVIALAIRLSSTGPVLFFQERVGREGTTFRMIKFRTMWSGAESHDASVGLGMKDDPRVTPVGQVLRRSNLDELPQLWNVLVGDMSIVGPRPERTYHARQFEHEFEGYSMRYRVLPGMTGWAQIHGWRGDTSLKQRIRYDLQYVERRTLGLDCLIVLRTLLLMVRHDAAIGASQGGPG